MASKNICPHVNVRHCSQCQGDTEYHCLTCEKNLCPACKIKHSIHLDTKEHDIRLYKYKNIIHRTHEPCKEHPSQDYEMYCKNCDIPFCVDCKDHKAHSVRDVMTVYKEHKEIINIISRETLYNLQVLLSMIKVDYTICKYKMDSILSEMIRELQKAKHHLDTVTVDVYLTEKVKFSFREISEKQTVSMNKHLSKIKIFDKSQHKSAHKPVKFIRSVKKTKLPDIEMTPVCVQQCMLSPTKGNLRVLVMLLNEIQENERRKRSIRSENLLRLMSVPELQKCGSLKNVASCEHISCVAGHKVWISGRNKLVLIDIPTRNIIHTINDVVNGVWLGLHTVNIDCELFYISNDNSIIKLSNDRKTSTKFLDSYFEMDPPMKPRSLYCSLSTGDLLIGMHIFNIATNKEIGIVKRFNKIGEITMTIPRDDMHNAMFKDPDYITENNNGDVVVSDYWRGVVVTDHEGNHRFTYTDTPFGSRLLPRGICTDALSHILVCDCYTDSVHILDQGGKFLLNIPTDISLGPLGKPCSLSYDWNTHILWVGSWNNTLSMYRHINRHLDLNDSKDICADYRSELPSCFNNPMHSEELDLVLSAYRRRFDRLTDSMKGTTSLAETMKFWVIEMINLSNDEFLKAGTLRASKHFISMEKAMGELREEFSFKLGALLHAIVAEKIIGVNSKNIKELKIFLQETEIYILNVLQKAENRHFEEIIMRIVVENDTFLMVKELLRERMEKIEKTINKEKASIRKLRYIFKDIYNLVMDVLSIFNQEKETTEGQ